MNGPSNIFNKVSKQLTKNLKKQNQLKNTKLVKKYQSPYCVYKHLRTFREKKNRVRMSK